MPHDEQLECPLCMEPLDLDDLNFFPCTCGYQICRFCWHRIRTDENSLCPACRKEYEEAPAEFKPISEEEMTKMKRERKQKDVARKQKAAENRRHLANIRVVQKNLVFVVGLSNRLADSDVLKRQEYFGKYGKIVKVVINSSTSYAGAQGPSASAYITYTRPEDCLRAIQAVNNLYVDGRTLKASLGTTKYCSHFLKSTQCTKSDCMYLHELGDEEASFTKEEMQSGKHQDYEQKLVDQYLTPLTTRALAMNGRVAGAATSSVPTGSTTGSAGITIIKHSHRKKMDSGSSSGSSKAKEAWPMLTSSNKNQSSIGQSNDDPGESVITDNGTHVEDTGLSEQRSSPDRNGSMKHNHSPQSSICSSMSNPRTPTPDTSGAPSPKLPNQPASDQQDTSTTAASSSTGLDQSESSEKSIASAVTTTSHPNTDTQSRLMAARKLPFEGSNVNQSEANRHNDIAELLNSSSMNGGSDHGCLQFTGLNKEIDALLPSVSNPMPAWPTTFGYTPVSDDDLGFDPFFESNKALTDMLENESGQHISPMPSSAMGFRSPSIRGPPPPPGVPIPAHLPMAPTASLFTDGIMSSLMQPMLPATGVVTSSSSSPLPPPPGLPGFPQFPPASSPNTQDMLGGLRGSRMLGLMNQNQSSHQQSSMMPSSPVTAMSGRTFYNGVSDPRMGTSQPTPPITSSYNGTSMHNGMSDVSHESELERSLKALFPNININVAPSMSSQQSLQQSRLKSSYVSQHQPAPPSLNHSMSWNGTTSSMIDDQFLDPAIIGCLSSDRSNSPSTAHWMKALHQSSDTDLASKHTSAANIHPTHSQYAQPFRQTSVSHSRMPFAQNLHTNQPANSNGWPSLQPHNPPPGFPSAFRTSAQNPRLTTLEG